MDDFVVSGSDDTDESYTKRKKKKGNSRSYKDDSWDSEVTSDEDYRKKKSAKTAKSSKSKKSKSKPKSKSKSRRYSEDSDVEFESTKIDRKNILEDDEDDGGPRNRKTRGKRTKYNLILDDSSESEAEKSKGAGKQIKNCIGTSEEEFDAKEESDEDDASDEDPDEYIEDDDSKEKSDNDSGDIKVQTDGERTSNITWSRFVLFIYFNQSDI